MKRKPPQSARKAPFQPVQDNPFQPVQEDPFQPVQGDPFQPVQGDPLQIVQGDPLQPVQEDPLQSVQGDPLQSVQKDPLQKGRQTVSLAPRHVAERVSRLNQALPRGKVRRSSPTLYDAAKPVEQAFSVKQIFDCVAINPRGTTYRQRHNPPATHPTNGEGNDVAERVSRLNQLNPRGKVRSG